MIINGTIEANGTKIPTNMISLVGHRGRLLDVLLEYKERGIDKNYGQIEGCVVGETNGNYIVEENNGIINFKIDKFIGISRTTARTSHTKVNVSQGNYISNLFHNLSGNVTVSGNILFNGETISEAIIASEISDADLDIELAVKGKTDSEIVLMKNVVETHIREIMITGKLRASSFSIVNDISSSNIRTININMFNLVAPRIFLVAINMCQTSINSIYLTMCKFEFEAAMSIVYYMGTSISINKFILNGNKFISKEAESMFSMLGSSQGSDMLDEITLTDTIINAKYVCLLYNDIVGVLKSTTVSSLVISKFLVNGATLSLISSSILNSKIYIDKFIILKAFMVIKESFNLIKEVTNASLEISNVNLNAKSMINCNMIDSANQSNITIKSFKINIDTKDKNAFINNVERGTKLELVEGYLDVFGSSSYKYIIKNLDNESSISLRSCKVFSATCCVENISHGKDQIKILNHQTIKYDSTSYYIGYGASSLLLASFLIKILVT